MLKRIGRHTTSIFKNLNAGLLMEHPGPAFVAWGINIASIVLAFVHGRKQ